MTNFGLIALTMAAGLASTGVSADALTHEPLIMSQPWPIKTEARLDFNFNRDWQFYLPPTAPTSLPSEALWEHVNLPHSVRLEPLNASGGRNYQGVCWYRKHFVLQKAWAHKVIQLQFQGAMQVADITLNGHHLLTHYGGYLPFTVDITKSAKFTGDNILTVRLNNSDNAEVPPGKPQGSLDFVYFGGLYRDVNLEVLNPVHISDPILANKVAGGGVFVTYPNVTRASATVSVQTEIENQSGAAATVSVVQTLTGPNGVIAGSASHDQITHPGVSQTVAQQIEVKNPKLWHPYHPYLYVLHTEVRVGNKTVDDQYTRLGIRTIRFDTDSGLYINGERFFSLGANRHQDHPYVGYAVPDSDQYRDAKKLRDAGLTSYRSHYPQSPAFMDACDELGILAIVSNPGWQFTGDDLFKQRVYENARLMVRRDRNHPSAVLWEGQLNESDNNPTAATVYSAIHSEYPGDQCYTAGDANVAHTATFHGWDVEYSYNTGQKPLWTREWGDGVDNWSDQQGSARVSRTWGETPMLVQAYTHLSRLDDIWKGNDGPAGPNTGRLCGADLWAGIDCYRGYHTQPFYGGIMDLFRLPKFDYYMFQSQRPLDVNIPNVDCGPMVFVANFATPESPSTVTVFSNCDSVRLTVNGKVVGTQTPDSGNRVPHPPFTFHVGAIGKEQSMLFSTGVAEPGTAVGEIKAEGLIGGKVAAAQTVYAPGVPAQLVLSVDQSGRDLTADGSDWIRVYARVCDSRGTVYPYSDDPITFSVSGPGVIVGDSSIGANPADARAGIATVLVKSTTHSGTITVTASRFGLKPGETQFTSIADTSRHLP